MMILVKDKFNNIRAAIINIEEKIDLNLIYKSITKTYKKTLKKMII